MKPCECVILLILFIFITPGLVFASENNNYFWVCNKKDKCDLYASPEHGNSILIYEDWGRDEKDEIVYQLIDKNIASFQFSCGNFCNFTRFVDLKLGIVSDSFYNVLAINEQEKTIALPDRDDPKDKTIKIRKIFTGNTQSIKIRRHFFIGSDYNVLAKFDKKGNFLLEYQTSDDDDCDESISINYKILKIRDYAQSLEDSPYNLFFIPFVELLTQSTQLFSR